MQTSQKSKLKVEHLQRQPSKMYGFVHWTWFRYSMQTIDCFRNTTVLRSPPNPFPIRKWFTNQCLAISYLAQQSWLPIDVYAFFSILFYFLFLIVMWSHRQSQVDFSIFFGMFVNLTFTISECFVDFSKTCCQFQAASAVTVILDLFSCWVCECLCQSFMQHMRANRWAHNAIPIVPQIFAFVICLSKCSIHQIWIIWFLILFMLFEKWKWWYKNIHKIIKAFSKHFL